MSEPAFMSDELDLAEHERVGARLLYAQFGPVPVDKLIEGLRRHGRQVEGYVETALGLPLDEYRRVKEVYDSLPAAPRQWRRRRK